jgi:hypothetical protein
MDCCPKASVRNARSLISHALHDVMKPSNNCLKPTEPGPKPKIYDENERHGLDCHITHG